jgi:hypothetical protein
LRKNLGFFPVQNPSTPGVVSRSLKILARVGAFARDHWREVQYVAAVLSATLFLSILKRLGPSLRATTSSIAKKAMISLFANGKLQ